MKKFCSWEKYLVVFKNSWQTTFEYRVNTWVNLGIASITLISTFYLWNTIYIDQTELVGYTKQELITYYILIGYLLASIYVSLPIAGEIRNGELSKYLTKPIGYFLYHYWQTISQRFLRLLLGLPVLIGIGLFFSDHLFIVTNPVSYIFLFLTTLGAIHILFFLDVLVGLLEFWILYSDSLNFMIELIGFFFAGTLIPLAFLPSSVQTIAHFLPFPYIGSFLVESFMQHLSFSKIFHGIGIQLFWIILLFFLTKMVWKQGMKKFEALGG